MSRARIFGAALAVLGLGVALVPWAVADVNHRFSATVAPAAVQPLSDHAYTIAILNRQASSESAQSAAITVPSGFVVDPSTVAAATTTAGGCSAATWNATLGVASISVSAPDPSSELGIGCTLNVSFSALTPAVEGTYTWTTSVSRGTTSYDIQGPQPKVTVDGTPPPAPSITQKPANPSNDSTPTFAFSDSDTGATFQCQLDGSGFSACPTPTTYSTVADGPHTFAVKAVDAAGNESGPTSYSWTIDTAPPPAPTIDSHPPNPDTDTSPTFSFSDPEAGAAFECRLDSASYAACGSPKNYANLGDGSHTFRVRAVDAAGNPSGEVTYTWTIDATAPPAPTIASGSKPPNPTSQTGATFSFSDAEAGVTFQCELDGHGFSSCTSPKSYSGLSDGGHTFSVRALDAQANVSTPASYTWTVDTKAPPVPTIDSQPSNPSGTGTASFSFSDSEGGVAFQCQLDGGGFSDCASPKSYSALSNGSHTFQVRARDGAGNLSATDSYTWTIDTANPVVVIDSAPADPTNNTAPTFSFHSTKSGSTFQCQLDRGGFSTCTSPKSYGPLPAGAHTFEAKATSLGNTGLVTSYAWTIDVTPPAPPAIAPGPPPATNQTSAKFAFTGEAGATFECRLDGAGYSSCASPVAYSGLTDGAHQFAVRAKDAAGNTGSAATDGWTVDTVAPNTTITRTPDPASSSSSATFEFASDEPLTSFSCSLDGSAFASCSSPQTYGGLGNGSHTFAVRASDLAGNTDPTPASYSWRVDTLTPPDTTPPGTVRGLRRTVAYRRLKLSWSRPPDTDFDHVRVLMSRTAKGVPRTVVYQGSASSYRNSRFQNGTYYRYALIAYDHAGNASRRVTLTVPPSALLRSPADGAAVKVPPRLVWAPVPRATYYNVQLYSPSSKLLSVWPATAALSLSRSWSYSGRRFVLTKGLYRWFVWPGFGPRSQGRYGQLVGQSSFRVR